VTAIFSNLPPPVFGSASFNGGNNFVLNAQGVPLQPWILQSSTNLVNWLDIVTNPADANGFVQFPAQTNSAAQQFFRIRSP
jgi:hypothetical protein